MGLLSRLAGFVYTFSTRGTNRMDSGKRERCLALRQEEKLGLVVVDELQLMDIPGSSGDRTQQMSEIARQLKGIAMELGVPVVILSQLCRTLEQRHDKRPQLSDLHRTGALEHYADRILSVYRDEIYHPKSKDPGIAEITILKNRGGTYGMVRLGFQGETAWFETIG